MIGKAAGLAVFGAMLMAPAQANAGVAEVHVGLMRHNICVTNCKNADKEDGPNVEFQVSFDSPEFLGWAFAPQPYVMASVNTAGDTSFGGAGLEWSWKFAPGWALEPGLGYVIHSGELENPYANGTPEAAAFAEAHVQYGSRDLFRTSLALTREIGDAWEVQLLYEHLSHGQILGEGRNQGVDQIGLRLGYRFGD
ncbi:MAG TPA: acyloxyacyl hydrolase [Terricaulis sp.]|nr:acyloxyacyl hydrolase [Terricaulis sp.]